MAAPLSASATTSDWLPNASLEDEPLREVQYDVKERQVVVTLVQEGFKDDYFCVDGESNARWCVYRHWSVSRESG